MPASRSKGGAIITGATAGLLAVVILLLVPVIGVRKELKYVILDWQEIVLYASCLFAGTVAGARVAFREAQAEFIWYAALTSDMGEIEIAQNATSSNASEQVSRTAGAIADDDLPLLTEPVIEESLAGGPKKPKKGLFSNANKSRTLVLFIFLYLVLFVMCSVLCQRLNLGSIVSDPITAEIIRNVGLGLSVAGLYLIVRGLFINEPSEIEAKNDLDGEGGALIESSAPHVPPTKLSFLRRHPVCVGWLVALTGLPLVFQAWFPLIAIPGIFVAMNWLFPNTDASKKDVSLKASDFVFKSKH